MTPPDEPGAPPPGLISIDPDDGFGPHMTDAFLDHYGRGSVFVTATVDCLTWRFVGVLIRDGRLPADFEPIQYGSAAMRLALEELLGALQARGLEKAALVLMRSATGYEAPQAFQARASEWLGTETVASWLELVEREEFDRATALLAVH